MFPCGYVKILQPVAICTVIFVTDVNEWLGSSGSSWVEGQEGWQKREQPADCVLCQIWFGKMI